MKELGVDRKILGVKIIKQCDKKRLYVSQEIYLRKILEKFGMTNFKPISTPLASHYKLSDENLLRWWRNNILWTFFHMLI